MRIGILAPLEMRVPPVGYGGTELVVSLLTEGLVKLGHDVTLFASGDSITGARLISVCPEFLRGKKLEKSIYNLRNAVACLQRANQFEIIHNHTQLEGLSMAGLTRTPMLTTLHGDLKGDWRQLFLDYQGWYNTISESAKKLLPDKERYAGVIYNAIDVKSYPFNEKSGDYLLYLSRINRDKGPHIAIEVAKRLNRKLILAGNIDTPDEVYFREEVLPGIDNNLIQFIGEADLRKKKELLSGAYCLLAPIIWEEPFGLFMAEAMACGTPVVVFKRGSAPEVVSHGETGFVLDTIDQMVDAVKYVPQINRRRCREHVAQNFDVPLMVERYIEAYRMVMEKAAVLSESKIIAK
jgi:glycosyltransferase involved in cell wall biosynthesis